MPHAKPYPALTRLACVVLALLLAPLASHAAPPPSAAPRTLDDYRHFRAAAIDLLGRMPTRMEIEAFERADFDFDRWMDQHLASPAYVDRLTRIYMDLLRLEPNVNFFMGSSQLSIQQVTGHDGKKIDVLFRFAQRRVPEAIDGQFCFTRDETFEPPPKTKPAPPPPPSTAMGAAPPPKPPAFVPPVPKKISQKLLDERTVLVRPWWLYRDYRDAHPTLRYQEGWKITDPEYRPTASLLADAEGKPIVEVRVCREEAQAGETGHVYASGRTKPPPPPPKPKPGEPFVFKPIAPLDKPFATQHHGEVIACDTKTAFESTTECGCGRGLERCLPAAREGSAFEFPNHMPLGPGMPLDEVRQPSFKWYPYWWSREVVRFLGYLFGSDVDFREILTGKETVVNGPLAQFYRSVQRGHCCGPEAQFGMTEETEPLFDPKAVPADLMPHDVGNWQLVGSRGPHAAGILTMPMFLEKYATARARAAVLYNAFLCKSFIAENVQLMPSSENNLMKRPGCSTCHATLEPLAAYFARIEAGDFVFLPPSKIPVINPVCKPDKNGKMTGGFGCTVLYDPVFGDANGSALRFAYGSPANADETPVGAAREITAMPEFGECAASRVASSFLGRALNADDEGLVKDLTSSFKASGFKMRALVRGVLRSRAYRQANNLSSTSWRVAPEPAGPNARGATPAVAESPHGGAK